MLVFWKRSRIICYEGLQDTLWHHGGYDPAQRHHKGVRHVYIVAATVGITGGSNKLSSGKLLDIIHTYTMQGRVLLEKLTGSQLVKKFPAFYGTWRFITTFTSARHLSLSWASSIQSIPPHPTSWRSFLILSSHFIFEFPWFTSL